MLHPDDHIKNHFRLKPFQENALKKLGLTTLRDLLFHFPSRYQMASERKPISALTPGCSATIYGTIRNLTTGKTFRGRMPIAKATLDDGTKTLELTWFNQPYIAKMLTPEALVRVSGKVGTRSKLSMANPEIEVINHIPENESGPLFEHASAASNASEYALPVYPESRGITSRWIFYAVQKILAHGILTMIEDPIPADILKKYHLPRLSTALIWIHAPKRNRDGIAARKRFAFEEVFLIQLGKQQSRKAYEALPSCTIVHDKHALKNFMDRFPFAPTAAQQKAIDAIMHDFTRNQAMSRLLEGDVGSGKTFVAAATAYAVVTTRPNGKDFGNYQTAYMAPTEILAKQQFESFISFFRHLPIHIGLLTSAGCQKFPSKVDPTKPTTTSKAQLLRFIANGEIPILIGTHALIQKSVVFKNLAYVIIDEQHRFGTAQRAQLVRKDSAAPHLLSMTATPIPRTLALTLYGDLDLTLLDEMPEGRKRVITEIVAPQGRQSAYEAIRSELASGRQAYIICPRIDEPDPEKELALIAKSVTEEAERLKRDIFPEYAVGVLHGKMKPSERDEVMRQFTKRELHILVATSVVEVGLNIPNATIIMIEGAERFGLAQLHQLRGRVIRSTHQPYCYALSESKTATVRARLKALKHAKNGFELAEHDLRLRGAGELFGRRQWGMSDVGMEALRNIKMVEAARNEARAVIEKDQELQNNPLLAHATLKKMSALHFE